MTDTFVVAVEGLEQLQDIRNLPEAVLRKARQAINRATERARTEASRRIREQVNFKARYLINDASESSSSRLYVKTLAKGNSLEAVIKGRERPTSLARFASGTPQSARKAGGVRVSVKPGSSKMMKGAFLMRLRQGGKPIDTASNLGLAIRLRPGESVNNKRHMVQLRGNLYLLYGASVNQVFRTVSEDVSPKALDWLEQEFDRLMRVN